MKKLLLSLVAVATFSLSSYGQAPEGFKYQAVARGAGNTILNNGVSRNIYTNYECVWIGKP